MDKLDTCTGLSRKKGYMYINGSPFTPHYCTNSKFVRKTSCISIVEATIVTHKVKHIDIPVYFLQRTI